MEELQRPQAAVEGQDSPQQCYLESLVYAM